MKKITLFFVISFFTTICYSQTVHQVCISEVSNAPCSNNSGVFTPATLTIAVGDQIKFTTYMMGISGGYDGSTHTIQFNGGSPQDVNLPVSSNILSQVTTVTTPAFTTTGTFTMECINASHCFNFAQTLEGWSCTAYSVTVNNPTKVNKVITKNLIKVYPNPSNRIINIDLSAITSNNSTIYLFDALGKIVQKMENVGGNLFSIDISSFHKGIYFIKIVSDSSSFTSPIYLKVGSKNSFLSKNK